MARIVCCETCLLGFSGFGEVLFVCACYAFYWFGWRGCGHGLAYPSAYAEYCDKGYQNGDGYYPELDAGLRYLHSEHVESLWIE